MPIKPDQDFIDIAKQKVDPCEVLQVILNEDPTLNAAISNSNLEELGAVSIKRDN